jgi:hypothetical protein
MQERLRRFSLSETFFEGSRLGGREDCLSSIKAKYRAPDGRNNMRVDELMREFRSAENKDTGTA